MTAIGLVEAKEEATVHINHLSISLCVQLVEDSQLRYPWGCCANRHNLQVEFPSITDRIIA